MTNIIISGVNLNQGSSVLLGVPEDYEWNDVIDLKEGLESQFPGVKFVLLQGLEIIGAYDAEPEILKLES